MSDLLMAAANPALLSQFEKLFVHWSVATLLACILFAFTGSQWMAFVSLLAFAVFLSSVVNLRNTKESK